MNKASNQEDEGDRLCGRLSHLRMRMDSQPAQLSSGWHMPVGGLLVVVKWLAETSFLRLLWLQVVVRKD